MAWLRLYDSILDDPKIQMLSDRAFRMLINLWCLAKRRGGVIPDDIGVLMFAFRWPEGRIRDTLQALISARLVERVEDGYAPHDWAQHQYDSDSAAERMQRYRARNKQRNALRNSDVLEPDTDTEPESTPCKPPNNFPEWYEAYPRKVGKLGAEKAYQAALKQPGVTAEMLLKAAKNYASSVSGDDPKFTAHPKTWLNAGRWLDAEHAQRTNALGFTDSPAEEIPDAA